MFSPELLLADVIIPQAKNFENPVALILRQSQLTHGYFNVSREKLQARNQGELY